MNYKKILLFFFFAFSTLKSRSHPMPNSMVLLKIHEKSISGEIQIPLGELQSAIGMEVNDQSNQLIERLGDTLKTYLLQHIRPRTFDGKPWHVSIGEMRLDEVKSKLTGDYKELIAAFTMTPPPFYDLRNFLFDYDVILHNVASHRVLIAVKQDWKQGIVHEDTTYQQVGLIEWDIATNKLNPFQISLSQGSTWQGFKSMLWLGIKHIAEGTDHLLFLLVLLIPVPLLVNQKKWGQSKDTQKSIFQILKIVTAFTIGHSITLLIGSLGLTILPTKIIEVLIGVSILVSAIHAIKPIFAGKEVFIALGFGFIHGLAFANSITDLQLSTTNLLLSILGFNVGIELMQIVIIVAIIPWLLILSRTSQYTPFRNISAVIALLASLAWIVERMTEQKNFGTTVISHIESKFEYLYLGLITLTLAIYIIEKKYLKSTNSL